MHWGISSEAHDDEDGSLLLAAYKGGGTPLGNSDEGQGHNSADATRARRYSAPKLSLRTMLILSNILVITLVGLAYYRWPQQYPFLPIPEPTTTDNVDSGGTDVAASAIISPSTPAATPTALLPDPVSKLPPSDSFDLKKTGFVLSGTATLREYVFSISLADGQPDGFTKQMVLINGQSPGPLIEANIGDTIRIAVHNTMADDPVTVHWHGIDQRNSVWMDGVFSLTQCGIPPSESFTYEFVVPEQRGTFWYHSHVAAQYADGLYGPIVIHDPGEMIDQASEDKVVMLGDLYYRAENELLNEYLGTAPKAKRMVGMEPSPDNFVINGRHVADCTTGSPGQVQYTANGELTYSDCQHGSLYSTRVRSGGQARLRLISHSSNIPLWFSVDGHVLQIVEMDGVEVSPIATTRVFLQPGQRYSVLLTTNQPAANYRMRATAVRGCAMVHFNGNVSSLNYEATGLISYDDVDVTLSPSAGPWDLGSKTHSGVEMEPWGKPCDDFAFDLAKPRRTTDAYIVSEQNSHHVRFEMHRDADALRTFIDGAIFSPAPDRALLWDFSAQTGHSGNFSDILHVKVSSDDKSAAQIAISAANMMNHPWHLHGQAFQVVGWGKGVYGSGKTVWNMENPMRRDTVTIPGNTHIVIRIKADNPGIWALHCHIQWHAEGGMFAMTAQRLEALQELLHSVDGDYSQKFCHVAPV